MRFWMLIAAPAILSIAFTAAAAKQERHFEQVQSTDSGEEACTTLRQVRLKKVKAQPVDPIRFDAFHTNVRGRFTAPSSSADLVIRVGVTGGMTAHGIGGPESIVAWRRSDGVWQASSVFQVNRAPPQPEMPLAPMWPRPAGDRTQWPSDATMVAPPDSTRDVFEGTLTPDVVGRLEQALQATCFKLEPPTLPLHLPLRSGPVEPCVPDSAHWILDIRDKARMRTYSRPCHLVGPVGQIALLLASAPLKKVTPLSLRAGLYPVDPAPTPERMHQFLADKLPGNMLEAPELGGRDAITAYKSLDRCTSEFTLRGNPSALSRIVRRNWGALTSFPAFPDAVTLTLPFNEGVLRLTLPGSVGAFQVEGAFFALWSACRAMSRPPPLGPLHPSHPAPADPSSQSVPSEPPAPPTPLRRQVLPHL